MPPQANLLETIRSTCRHVAEAHKQHVAIDEAAVQQLASSLDPGVVMACARGLQLPVRFDSLEAEVSFLAMYHLLDFGTGYNPVLVRRYKRDQREMLQYAVLGMHMGAQRLDAAWMAAFSSGNATSHFGIETHEDVPVPNLPCVTMSKPGVLAELVSLYTQAVREAGAALQEEGAASMGQAIITLVDGLHKRKPETQAAALVQEMVEAIPAFADQGLYEGTRVVFARKAQALVFELHSRFHREDPRFDFKDVASLTGDSGPTAAAVLRAKGVLKYSEELAATVDAEKELPAGAHERGIRAACVCAMDALVESMGMTVTAAQLSAYLEYLAEPGQELHGQIRRHVTRNTMAY